jgi:transcription elongation factor GreA
MRYGEENMREQLTQKDVEKIEQEIEHRKLVVRPEAIEAVKEARAQGDLSENFEYYAAKKYKNQNESRIRYLENMLKNARVISDKSAEDEVGMDDIVEVFLEEDNETEKYKLVTSIRGNSMENRISIESPIGKALLGHKEGDVCHVAVRDDYGYDIKILSIEKTNDDSEDELKKY